MAQFLPLILLAGVGSILGIVFMFAFKLDQNDWRTKLYPIFMLLFGGGLGVGLHFGSASNPMNLPAIYMGIQLVVMLIGIFHLWFLYKKLFWSKRSTNDEAADSFLPETVYTLTILFFIAAGLMAAYGYFAGFQKIGDFWAVSVPFVIPFLFTKSYDFLNQFPRKDFSQKWGFAATQIKEDNWRWENETWIYFEVKERLDNTKIKENRAASFRIKAPRKVPLREVFRLAIREYNKNTEDIVVQDLGFEKNNQGKFWWLFSIKFIWNQPSTWFRKMRYLDPYSSTIANDILPKDVILAQRMWTKEAFENLEEYFEDNGEIAIGELIEE